MSIQSCPDSVEAEATRSARNPHVFVVGCQRSGTTMLQRMLDAHPALAVAYDSLFILRPLRGRAPGDCPPLDDNLVRAAVTHPRFGRLGLSDEAVERSAARSTTYAGFIGAIYDEYASMHGKPLSGEKSPGFCRRLPQLHALLPGAKIVHLIRDGRDVALSIKGWGKGAAKLELWREHPVAVGALWWRRDVSLGCADGRRLDPSIYTEARYERLVAEPEAALRDIAGHLGISYTDSMASYHEGRVKHKEGLSAKAAWLPPTVGIRDWRTQMEADELELFEAIAGRELEMLGYERACAHPSDRASGLAAECERWWSEHVGETRRSGSMRGEES